jgi:hypothetical protein
VVAALVLAPSAAAKGPHALVEPGPAGIEPGERWVATLTLIEFGGREVARAHPRVVLRSGSDRFVVRPRRIDSYVPRRPDVPGSARYRLSMVFPSAGTWSYTVYVGASKQRRFEFQAVVVGGDSERDRTAFVAFPKGSPEARQGAGGPIFGDGAPDGGGEPLPPEVVMLAAREGDGGGLAWWIPAAGLALAGAGTLTVVRRRR